MIQVNIHRLYWYLIFWECETNKILDGSGSKCYCAVDDPNDENEVTKYIGTSDVATNFCKIVGATYTKTSMPQSKGFYTLFDVLLYTLFENFVDK